MCAGAGTTHHEMTFFRSANGAVPYQPGACAPENDRVPDSGLKARAISEFVKGLHRNDGTGLQLARFPATIFPGLRHLGPVFFVCPRTWDVAPGWYVGGPLALKKPPRPRSTDPRLPS
jgi:hypothetical protein